MDITVWMSSPNDVVPAVAEAGTTRVARGGSSQTVPERPSVAAWALVYPRVGDRARRQPGVGFRKIGEVNYIEVELRAYFRPIGIRPIIRNKFRGFRTSL
ncbi:hypothetical protein EVAR_56526_1 [Eumeta japonica]|uniref:Uncharacterized protein n=1 Tax=Eumeta variegata TaxID=151549 RepID=A0A4C1ZSB3_EUMVA|nr:hypothetical protein EVAR_56526_1 [Eumeta japonica]